MSIINFIRWPMFLLNPIYFFPLPTLMIHSMVVAVRTALVALIAFMPTAPNGALGSLDYKKEERRDLAIRSREASPKFGTPERQKVIDEVSLLHS